VTGERMMARDLSASGYFKALRRALMCFELHFLVLSNA
jgi:hypothetical protein